jgi:hypothetical protein
MYIISPADGTELYNRYTIYTTKYTDEIGIIRLIRCRTAYTIYINSCKYLYSYFYYNLFDNISYRMPLLKKLPKF